MTLATGVAERGALFLRLLDFAAQASRLGAQFLRAGGVDVERRLACAGGHGVVLRNEISVTVMFLSVRYKGL